MLRATQMGSVYAIKRTTQVGEARWHVRYQGSALDRTPTHLGVAHTVRERDTLIRRARLLMMEGVEPSQELLAPKARQRQPTISEAADRWLAGRVDLATATRKSVESRVRTITRRFGSTEAAALTRSDIQAWVGGIDAKPGTIRNLLSMLRMILDEADVASNPARDPRVRAPRQARSIYSVPTRSEYETLLHTIHPDYRILVEVLAHTGLRISEFRALRAEDRSGSRILVRESKTSRPRWVVDLHEGVHAYPPSVTEYLDNLEPFPYGYGTIRKRFEDASRIRPHTLRHLHATRLMHDGWNAVDVAQRLGHASVSVTLSTYVHVTLPADWSYVDQPKNQ